MDFSRQLASLARAANSNSRDGGDSNSNSNTNSNNNSQPPFRQNRHHYHPYHNNRRGGGTGGSRAHRGGGQGLTQAELEFYLPKLIEAIPKYQPITTLSNKKKSKRRHIALLFLTIDDLPFEHLWRSFLNNYKLGNGENSNRGMSTGGSTRSDTNPNPEESKVDMNSDHNEAKASCTSEESTPDSNRRNKLDDDDDIIDPSLSNSNLLVSVLCHAKFPERVKSSWLQQRLLVSKVPPNRNNNRHNNSRHHQNNRNNNYNNRRNHYNNNDDRNQNNVRYHTRRPEWGSVDITRAMIDLLEEGLKIGKSKSKYDHDERYSYARYMVNENAENDNLTSSSLDHQDKTSTSRMSCHTQSTKNDSIPEVDRFIFVSESCLPMVTLQEMELALFGPDENISVQHNSNNIHTNSSPKKRQRIPSDHQQTSVDKSDVTKSCHEHYSGVHANKSWMNAYNKPNNGYARLLQWDATSKAVPKNCIYKADQWIVLTRHHAWPLISLIDDAVKSVQQTFASNRNNDRSSGGHYNRHHNSYHSQHNIKISLWHCFEHVKASDEMYFPTAMALLGILNTAAGADDENGEGKTDSKLISTEPTDSFEGEIVFKKVTYCDWSEKGKNPMSFTINKQKDSHYVELKKRILMAREEGCLIGRKFVPGGHGLSHDDTVNVFDWVKMIQKAILTS